MKAQRVVVVGAPTRLEHGREIRAAAEPRLAGDDEARVHVRSRNIGIPRVGDDRQARRPEARVGLAAGNSLGEFRRQSAEHGRGVDAHLLEQAAAQHRHASPTARRAGAVEAAPRFDDEAARRDARRRQGAFVLERFHRRDQAKLQRREPGFGGALAMFERVHARLVAQPVARTRATRRSTWAIGVSGRMPWPRLKIWARPAKPCRTRAMA